MDRAVPTSSKLVSKRINDRNRQIHLSKLNSVKSTISRAPPKSFNHMKVNKKKHQLNEDRLTEIERENKILLDKMTTIMRVTQQAPAQPIERAVSRSLNVEYRKRELVKIAVENQSIMQRLQTQKPILNRQSWEDSRRQHELYLRNICEYPNTVGLPALRPSENSVERPQSFQISRDSFASMISPKQTSGDRFYTPNKELTTSKSMLVRKTTEKLDPLNSSATQKTILYQTKKKIGLGNYLIHVYLNNDVFNIMASNNERGDFKILSIPISEGEDLVRRFGSNYRELVNRIRFKGSKIVFETYSSTYDPTSNDRTGSQLMTNEGIVEDEEETDGDLNTTGNRKPQPPTIPNKVVQSSQETKSPVGQPEKSFGGRRASKPTVPDTPTKEQKQEVKASSPTNAQSVEISDAPNGSHGANAGSQGQLEGSAASEEEQKKAESAKSQKSQKSEKADSVPNEQETEKISVINSEVREGEEDKLVEEKEASEKVAKSQEGQIVEESVEFQESKEEQEKVKESINGEQGTEKESEIKEEKESQNNVEEEPVEEVIASKMSESKEDSK